MSNGWSVVRLKLDVRESSFVDHVTYLTTSYPVLEEKHPLDIILRE
jgi:hypothetical protein